MSTQSKQAVPKLDLRRQHRNLYTPSAKAVQVVDVPELMFTMLDGVIDAGVGPADSEEFRLSMDAMYGVGYGLKFLSKLRHDDPIDFTVMAVEGLWTPTSGTLKFGTRERMEYTLLMLQPEHITEDMLSGVVAQADAKRPNPALRRVRLERWREGPSIQIMHIGPYAEEPRTIRLMDDFAAEHGYRFRGRHHEIYLGDPRRAQPEKLKTILRHPIVG
jgi:hypothetical protein